MGALRMRVLILDDNDERHEVFRERLIGCDRVHVHTFRECVDALREMPRFDVAYLDHDLNDFPAQYQSYCGGFYGAGEMTGTDVARYIARGMPREKVPAQIVIHSWNPDGALRMARVLADVGIVAVREPFGWRAG